LKYVDDVIMPVAGMVAAMMMTTVMMVVKMMMTLVLLVLQLRSEKEGSESDVAAGYSYTCWQRTMHTVGRPARHLSLVSPGASSVVICVICDSCQLFVHLLAAHHAHGTEEHPTSVTL
jgi:hypothetical protein